MGASRERSSWPDNCAGDIINGPKDLLRPGTQVDELVLYLLPRSILILVCYVKNVQDVIVHNDTWLGFLRILCEQRSFSLHLSLSLFVIFVTSFSNFSFPFRFLLNRRGFRRIDYLLDRRIVTIVILDEFIFIHRVFYHRV